MKNCLTDNDFNKSSIFDEMAEAARALGYETISDMVFSEYQTTGSARRVARNLGFSKNAIIRYLKIMGVVFNRTLTRINRRHIIRLYRRGFSGKHCARLIDRNPTTTRRALLRALGPVEYNRLTNKHRLNKRGY